MAALNVANYETAIDALGKVVRMDEQYDSGAALLNLRDRLYEKAVTMRIAKTLFNTCGGVCSREQKMEATAKSNLNSMGDTTADDTKTAVIRRNKMVEKATKEKDMQKAYPFRCAFTCMFERAKGDLRQ